MKKIVLTTLFAIIAASINAQLVVDSLGRVGIGTETPWSGSILSVGHYGNVTNDAAIQLSVNGNHFGAYFLNHTSNSSETFGSFCNTMNRTGVRCFGERCEARGDSNPNRPSQQTVGVNGVAGEAPIAAGVMGGRVKAQAQDITVKFAGVYGSEYASKTLDFDIYPGSYAGFFNGKVRVLDGIYATLLSPSASPSPSGQNGATILSDRGESVTDKLSQVQTLQFLRYNPERNETIVDEDEDEEEVEIEPNLSAILYGLDADQLKAVYPELVYEDNNGNVSINYVEMVPLLVQCINELKNEIAELKGTSQKKAKAQPTTIEENVSDIDMVRMDQNKPNPFSESTVISLNIPQETQTANIYIYDMSGKQVQSLPVSERGETNITVYASDLAAGMYIYTLVVDGKVSVTRRMIVTKA